MTNISIVSTGLLHEADFSTIDYYTSIGPVIIQYWTNQYDNMIPIDKTTIVKIAPPSIPDSIQRTDLINFSYQALGILAALEKVNTKYVLRVRNDEHVTNLDPIIKKFLENTKRIISTSLFWHDPLRIGDHIFIAETDLLIETYTYLRNKIMSGYPLNYKIPMPEHALLSAFTIASRKKYKPTKNSEMIIDRADVIDINCLGNYLIINHPGNGTKKWTPQNKCYYPLVTSSNILENHPLTLYQHEN